MGTFLTTPRMPPALAARVDASVHGTRNSPVDAGRSRWHPRWVALARVVLTLAFVALVCGVVVLRRRDRRELERTRASLLEAVRAASASLPREAQGATDRIDTWLLQAAGAYEGDVVASDLRRPDALAATLARPSVYVRGTRSELSTPGGIVAAAASSIKDPLVACLIDPPATRTESALLTKVRDAYAGDPQGHMAHVRRLREAQVGLPFLAPAWAETVRRATSEGELDVLRDQFAKAPVEGAAAVAKAGLLLFAIDEPGEAGGATELDGERAHMVRVGIVDLAEGKVLLRMRRRVDPAGISATKRAMYASGLDGCGLALDVRESVTRPQ
jgi:hypothetical protein